MRFLQRFKTGLTLTRDSLAVLRHHPDLMLFPLISSIATLLFGAVLYLTVFVGGLIGGGIEYLALFVFYFVTTFVASFSPPRWYRRSTTPFTAEIPHSGVGWLLPGK